MDNKWVRGAVVIGATFCLPLLLFVYAAVAGVRAAIDSGLESGDSQPAAAPAGSEAEGDNSGDAQGESAPRSLVAALDLPASGALGDTWTRPTDEMVMVYVPAGRFEMGSESDEPDEAPVHSVVLSAFWLDQNEVTNGQYRRCSTGGPCPFSQFAANSNQNQAAQPVVGVTWFAARDYCLWVGGRLPTEAEWEYAARGPDGLTYPWGNDFDGTRLNFEGNGAFSTTAAVGSLPAGRSWVGADDMAGNVWEWVSDWYDEDYYDRSPLANPTGPNEGRRKVLRGGSWSSGQTLIRLTMRVNNPPATRTTGLGFRCVVPGP